VVAQDATRGKSFALMTKRFVACLTLMIAAACGSSAASTDTPDGGSPGNGSDGGGGGDDGSTSNDDGGTTPPGDSGTIMPSTGVSIIVEPNGNDASELIDAIKAATTSVYMVMYQIDDTKIIDAIIAQESAGHDVKIVLDGSSTNKTSNTPAFNSFNGVKAGTAVWSSSSFTYTHQKTVILDSKEAWIMTMNLNTSSPEDDREYLAIDDDAADVAEAKAIFLADYASTSITPTGNLVVSPTNSRADLVKLIGTATKSLDLEVEEFSDTDKGGIVDAVDAIASKGIPVHVTIANTTMDSTGPAAISDVKAAGGSVVMSGGTEGTATSSNPYIAGKTILIDCITGTCASGYVGSENFTANSLEYNRELGVILNDPTQLAKIYTAVSGDYSKGTPQ
jgi:phosphatidylserine/phosphatidylglycerophosphate/cardiolipin synthase-like enzyme